MPLAPPLRVLGLGASAGGLAPLIDFLQALPRGRGLACIVVQHLAADQPSALAALLQRHAQRPVAEVATSAPLQADWVYVIAPGTQLTVAQGQLKVDRVGRHVAGAHTIDLLFGSLAAALGPAAVGVVFSGLGSDGTEGLRAIVDAGGQGWVQTPETAQFDAMPRHALAIGRGVQAAAAAELPARILAAAGLAGPAAVEAPRAGTMDTPAIGPGADPGASDGGDPEAAALAGVLQQVRRVTGHDFSPYKHSTLRRRIERRMALHATASVADYGRLLTDNPQEAELLFKELLIGVTAFFRDAPVWQAMQQQVLPDLLARAAARPGATWRAWVAGCSTGEEAYSLAMLVREAVAADAALAGLSVLILATDLQADAIHAARRGVYPAALAQAVSPERLARHFVSEGEGWRVAPALRDMVLFARHDLVSDPPFTRLDLLSCRNLLIYFNGPLQQRLLPLFHYLLQPGGVLMLGSAESVGRLDALLVPIDPKLRLYRRTERPLADAALHFPTKPLPAAAPMTDAAPPSPPPLATLPAAAPLQALADRLMLDEFSPPAVLANAAGDILYINGRTGRFLEPAAGKANWNLHAMAREGLRPALATALAQAQQGGAAVEVPGLAVDSGAGKVALDLLVRPVDLPGQGALLLVVFRELPPRARRRRRSVAPGDLELQRLQEETQALREEMRSSQEELQSTNEELQSTNEELQSANEELTTSKEEMQAMNEELQASNGELVAKLDDLALAQSDLTALLNSTQIATLFLDGRLHVRRFTEQARQVINLREGDVGRPLTDLTTALVYPELAADIARVAQTLVFQEKSVQTHDGRWFTVRVMPYRNQAQVIDGSVITFLDISAAKRLEARLRAQGVPGAPDGGD